MKGGSLVSRVVPLWCDSGKGMKYMEVPRPAAYEKVFFSNQLLFKVVS